MHPDILRDLVSQHGRELREQAHRSMLARTASRARKAARRGGAGADAAGACFVTALPAVPDYVDGSFRTAGDEASRRVPAARHAA